MRKYTILLLIAAIILTAATAAFAFGPGYGKGGGMGICNQANVSPEQAQKYSEFQKQILPQREKILALKTELASLHAQTKTDWEAIAQKEKEMVDIRIAIHKAARDAGFAGAGGCMQQNVSGRKGGGFCSPISGTKKMRMGGFNL